MEKISKWFKKSLAAFDELSKTTRNIIIAALAALVLFVGIGTIRTIFFSNNKQIISSGILEGKLLEASDLVSTKYQYKTVGVFSDASDFYGWTVPFTGKKFIVSYIGTMHAGVDLAQLQIDVDENNKVITIDLPEAKIFANAFHPNSVTVYDEENSIFNPISVSDMKEFQVEQEKKALEEAVANGLYDTVIENAEKAITELLNLIDEEIKENYQIKFK